ncbi:MAG: HIRAN domain-containing protein [Candidatus Heimdallarchaeaceae archaeon]
MSISEKITKLIGYDATDRDPYFKLELPEGDIPGQVIFTVAGFSQFSVIHKKNRQLLLQYIKERTTKNVGNYLSFPDDYKIELKPEPDNKYDKNAIRVLLKYEDQTVAFDLGFVPSYFNKMILSEHIKLGDVKMSSISLTYKDSDLLNLQLKIIFNYAMPNTTKDLSFLLEQE